MLARLFSRRAHLLGEMKEKIGIENLCGNRLVHPALADEMDFYAPVHELGDKALERSPLPFSERSDAPLLERCKRHFHCTR